MPRGDIETFHEDGEWHNRVEGVGTGRWCDGRESGTCSRCQIKQRAGPHERPRARPLRLGGLRLPRGRPQVKCRPPVGLRESRDLEDPGQVRSGVFPCRPHATCHDVRSWWSHAATHLRSHSMVGRLVGGGPHPSRAWAASCAGRPGFQDVTLALREDEGKHDADHEDTLE